jgi:lysylphosphatidylglycerol synthetase-like protein (DUF2156 family)
MRTWLENPDNRAWVYNVALAAVPVLVAYGLVSEVEAAVWLGLISAVLGLGLARKNVG